MTLRTKKCSNRVPIQVRVRLLLVRQADVAADAQPAGFLRAAVRGLHDAAATARHDGEARPGERAADVAGKFVVLVTGREACRPEDRHARPVELETLEPVQELEEEAHGALEVRRAVATPGQEVFFGALHLLEQRGLAHSFGQFRHAESPGRCRPVPVGPRRIITKGGRIIRAMATSSTAHTAGLTAARRGGRA
jgi:hypothetical protein